MPETGLEEQFGKAMKELIAAGLDFDEVASETVKDILGDSPYLMLAPKFKSGSSPGDLLRGFSSVFPPSVVGTVATLISKRAMESLSSPSSQSKYPEYVLLLEKLQKLPAQNIESGRNTRPLHDHREEDELDKIVGHRTE
jgi:hypothetical protein